MAEITNVVQVQLLQEPQLAQRANVNTVACFTSDQGGPINTANRAEKYTSIFQVADDFGTNSEVYDYASVFFSQTPNPVSADGYLVVGYWRGASEDVAATKGILTGVQLVEDTVVSNLQSISDGSFDITIDGVLQNVTGLDFRTALDLDDIASIVETAMTDIETVEVDNLSLKILTDTTGATSTITFASQSATGINVATLLGLSDGSGATLSQGTAATTLTPETKLEAVTEVLSVEPYRSFVFIDSPTDSEHLELAAFATSNDVLGGAVFSDADYLEVDATNVVWQIKLGGYTNYRMFYSKSNDRKLAIGNFSRLQTVLFTGTNTANTGNLKSITGVQPDAYSQSEIDKAYNVGLDIYTTIKDITVMLTSPANDFFDNVYNLIAYVDALEIDTFNILKASTTKIPQTTRGVNTLVDTIEKTTKGFVKAGVFAPGTWTSPETFGDPDTLARSIETLGYFVYANRLSDQSQADRQARKSPPIQIAVKNAGAIHSANLIVQFNI